MVLVAALLLLLVILAFSRSPSVDVSRHLAQYSPYFTPFPSVPYSSIPLPDGCSVDMVSILQRHGARYPTAGVTPGIIELVERLKAAPLSPLGAAEGLSWLSKYSYSLGTEDMVPLGIRQSREAGQEAYSRYGKIAAERGVFVRASSCNRVAESARTWVEGFRMASNGSTPVQDPLILSDAVGSNDTLANNNCPAHRPSHAHYEWARHFTLPIIKRLETWFINISFQAKDVIILFGLCAFDSVAIEGKSRFCNMFTDSEFLDFEYFQDLEKYYNRGYGNSLGPVQGVGYVNELLARLTGSPVKDYANTNRTLDNSLTTFPLNKALYADFSHDNTMAAIVSALGLFEDDPHNTPLSASHRPSQRKWKFGHIAPFSGRLVVERLACTKTGASQSVPYMRALADDALLPLPFCNSGLTKYGICTLDAFVKSQAYARYRGKQDWEKCTRKASQDYQIEDLQAKSSYLFVVQAADEHHASG